MRMLRCEPSTLPMQALPLTFLVMKARRTAAACCNAGRRRPHRKRRNRRSQRKTQAAAKARARRALVRPLACPPYRLLPLPLALRPLRPLLLRRLRRLLPRPLRRLLPHPLRPLPARRTTSLVSQNARFHCTTVKRVRDVGVAADEHVCWRRCKTAAA